MILSFVSWWKLYVRTGSLSCQSAMFPHRKHINHHVILDQLVFAAILLFWLSDVHFLKHELTYPWIMGCLLVVLLSSLFWDHFITSMTHDDKGKELFDIHSIHWFTDWKWIIFIVICWWWFYHAPARTMNLYVLTGYQMNLHATHPKI